MDRKITNIYDYTESNNPYSNGETISVQHIRNKKGEEYISLYINNDLYAGCGIFLTKDEVEKLIQGVEKYLKTF